MIQKNIDKLEDSLVAPWERLGVTPEVYITDLTIRWKSITMIINNGKKRGSVVKSSIKDTLTDTVEFIAWAQSKRELTAAVALIRTYMNRIKEPHDDSIPTKRVYERS